MLNRLQKYLAPLAEQGIALAFSGGVDSSLLLAVLAEMRRKQDFPFQALTMRSVLQDEADMKSAAALAERYGVKTEFFSFNPFSVDQVRQNRIDRCYWCKKTFFSLFVDYAKAQKLRYLLDGTNADDLKVYRPGQKALQEFGVISPLAELGISKAEIRHLSKKLGLVTADKPARPCLATRFEYDTELDEEKIKRVEKGEAFLRELFPDVQDVRLRVQKNLARIEVSRQFVTEAASHSELIVGRLKQLGFDFVTLDLEGFRSGSQDVTILS